RGIGKTTSARIFAKALNCKHPIDGEPCCECSSCKAIADESSVDVIEIDAATHTQVEKARDICEDVLHLPISSKYKIYIIDEVHMLSKSAWNALLKTIEEPPAHAKFIFATTEVNKVLPTVISRCQRFDLCRIPAELIANRLEFIASEEKIQISRSALEVIARAADGGMRDAQSLLDQLVSFFGATSGGESISEAQALSLFGLTAPGEMESLLHSILANDRTAAILSIHQFAAQGKNLETLFEEILTWLRGVLLSLVLPDPQAVLDENPEKINCYRKLAQGSRPDTLQILLEQLAASSYLLREAINKQVFMETILLKAMRAAHAIKMEDILIRLNEIRRNGELDGIEKIPSLARVPVQGGSPAPAAVMPSAVSIDTVPEQPAVPLEMPAAGKKSLSAETLNPSAPVSGSKLEKSEMTEPDTKSEVAENKQVEKNDEKLTDPENMITESNSSTAFQPNEEYLTEEPSDGSEEETTNMTEVPSVSEGPHSMSLKERFSPELLWRKLTESVSRIQPSLGAIMGGGFADRIENSTLHVLYDAKDDVLPIQMVTKDKSLIRNELRKMTGDGAADIAFALRDGLHSQPIPKRTLEELKHDAGANPMVKEVVDLFSGAIVDVME
ncbi:MAG: DNA polymerase III subunit gamma/tau, partial [Lentisphaeria bacterium]|nr:DNA polymerase III subunit gamma/tau [Lentisphaeria bacterium]